MADVSNINFSDQFEVKPKKANNFFKSSTAKLFFIAILMLVMMIPLGLVNNVIRDRESYRGDAVENINQSWARQQEVIGPVLSVPFRVYNKVDETDSKGKVTKSSVTSYVKYVNFLPEKLAITGQVFPEERYRGIFKTIVYSSDLKVSGAFPSQELGQIEKYISDEYKKTTTLWTEVLWKDAFISIAFSDLKGIEKISPMTFGDTKIEFQPGAKLMQTSVNAPVKNLSPESANKAPIQFSLSVKLRGNDYLKFAPLGKETSTVLASKWTNPSFVGNFLPADKKISQDGFSANWNVSYLSRGYPQIWLSDQLSQEVNEDGISQYSFSQSSFGVSLLSSIDFYRNSLRAVKYGILFIFLTFLAFFIFETVGKKKIHPFQYLLVGSSLCLFYLLLLSMCEFLGFNAAYILATFMTIATIVSYAYFVLTKKDRRFTLVTLGGLVFLYVYLYILLQLQDMSLLLGAIGLFLILISVMFSTRNIDWYQGESKESENNRE